MEHQPNTRSSRPPAPPSVVLIPPRSREPGETPAKVNRKIEVCRSWAISPLGKEQVEPNLIIQLFSLSEPLNLNGPVFSYVLAIARRSGFEETKWNAALIPCRCGADQTLRLPLRIGDPLDAFVITGSEVQSVRSAIVRALNNTKIGMVKRGGRPRVDELPLSKEQVSACLAALAKTER